MDRTTVPPHTGMIFVFDTRRPVAFWMKNTLVPLDMIFVAADGTVRRVFANVPVLHADTAGRTRFRAKAARRKYVIELHAGEAAQRRHRRRA